MNSVGIFVVVLIPHLAASPRGVWDLGCFEHLPNYGVNEPVPGAHTLLCNRYNHGQEERRVAYARVVVLLLHLGKSGLGQWGDGCIRTFKIGTPGISIRRSSDDRKLRKDIALEVGHRPRTHLKSASS